VSPNEVHLDRPAPAEATEAEVRLQLSAPAVAPRLSAVLRALPPGARSALEIEQQIEEERSSWHE
jgi:hypothetical protein